MMHSRLQSCDPSPNSTRSAREAGRIATVNHSQAVAALVLLGAAGCTSTRGGDDELVSSSVAASEPEPAPIPEPVGDPADVLSLAATHKFACALQRAGTVACWGEVPARSLGQDHDERIEGSVHVKGLADAVAIAVATDAGCAVRRNGSVVCWGHESPDWKHRKADSVLIEVEGIGDATVLYGGLLLMCATTKASGVWCWGEPWPVSFVFESLRYEKPGPARLDLEDVRALELGGNPAASFENGKVAVWQGKYDPEAPTPFDTCVDEIDADPELMRDCTPLLWDSEPPRPTMHADVVEVYSDHVVDCWVRTSGEVTCTKDFNNPTFVVEGLAGARQLVHMYWSPSDRILGVRPDGNLVGTSMGRTFGYEQQRLVLDSCDDVTAITNISDELFGIRHGRVYAWKPTYENKLHYKSREVTLPKPPTPK
jgi:hypothetical protein